MVLIVEYCLFKFKNKLKPGQLNSQKTKSPHKCVFYLLTTFYPKHTHNSIFKLYISQGVPEGITFVAEILLRAL